MVKFVRDVGFAAVRRECDANGAIADGDRRGHSVGRRGETDTVLFKFVT
jgi:hypothetical protein